MKNRTKDAESMVEFQEAPMPEFKKDLVIVKTLVYQVSTGTELTMLGLMLNPVHHGLTI